VFWQESSKNTVASYFLIFTNFPSIEVVQSWISSQNVSEKPHIYRNCSNMRTIATIFQCWNCFFFWYLPSQASLTSRWYLYTGKEIHIRIIMLWGVGVTWVCLCCPMMTRRLGWIAWWDLSATWEGSLHSRGWAESLPAFINMYLWIKSQVSFISTYCHQCGYLL